jgi:hypothetical protein
MRWALINGSKVANVVTQDDQPTIPGTWIACGNAGIGWDWHGGTSFTNPSQHTAPAWTDPDLAPAYWHIDVGSFMDRFGSKALALASSSDPAVQGLITLLMPRKYIDLKHPDLSSWLDLLVSKGLITSSEKSSILTTKTTEQERHVQGLAQPTD